MPFFKKTMKKVLSARGYKHMPSDDEFSQHGDYARNIQYAFSKEHTAGAEKVVDIVFLGADMHDEKVIVGFYRENLTRTNGVIENTSVAIPFSKYSIQEFEKQLDRMIPKKLPVEKHPSGKQSF